jgi:hemerythrin
LHIDELKEIPQTALAFINDDHAEEVRLLRAFVDVLRDGGDDAAVTQAWEALFVHTREHFGREEAAMRETGFPPYPVHKGEHDRVLAELQQKFAAFEQSRDRVALLDYAARGITDWFVGHLQSMDFITARFVAAQRGQ